MKKFLVTLTCVVHFVSAAWSADSWTGIGPTRKAPRHDMTKAEAAAYYGEPYHQATVGPNEQWFYHLKFSEVYGKAWVPFGFSSDNVTIGIITFGPDGKVKSCVWNHTVAR